ncbi:MAG: arylmalonate decarboxylase [Rhodospirillaceae bacterium]|jgi:maleate isomerase|nr:arylmalonate decarboxylase [Rhodospirillaceae bacterium]
MTDQRAWRAKIGVPIPSTNTMVQPDFDDLRPDGVTNHISRITIPNMALKTDEDFDNLIRICEAELGGAVDRVMTSEPDLMVIGISSLLVWDGREASDRRRDEIAERTGLDVTGGSYAVAAALEKLGHKRIAIISPYPQIANQHITSFFADSGFDVKGFVGLAAASPVKIADTTPEQLTGALDEVDSDEVEALIQFGTNVSFMRQAAVEEEKRGKPVLAINPVTYWHALRMLGIEEKIEECGKTLAGL